MAKAYYYKNGDWHQYQTAANIRPDGSFNYVNNSGLSVTAQGRPALFPELKIRNPFPGPANYFLRTKGGPSLWAIVSDPGETPPPQAAPKKKSAAAGILPVLGVYAISKFGPRMPFRF